MNTMKCKEILQTMRDSGWDSLFDKVSIFSNKYHIVVPNMNDIFIAHGRSRRKFQAVTNLHHYHVGLFY